MTNATQFNPNWSSHPGETLERILRDKNLSRKTFYSAMGGSASQYRGLFDGSQRITENTARKLSELVGGSKDFWLSRDAFYQDTKNKVLQQKAEASSWLQKLPITFMKKNGWIENTKKKDKILNDCLSFFGTSSIEEWHNKYDDYLWRAAFKTSHSFDYKPEAIVTWLRKAEIEALSSYSRKLDKSALLNNLQSIKLLSRNSEPLIFIPKLKNILSESGVSLAIAPTPPKCPARGATFFTKNQTAIVLLSFKYLSDDQFWFTLFHELGHLILHSDKAMFLEGVESKESKAEEEADHFALDILIPREKQQTIQRLQSKDWRKVVRLSKELGVSPGIIVGQLQRMGNIRYNQLNKLKRRYNWSDIRDITTP